MAIEGFTAFICFAAGHEIIRQRRRDLTLIRMTPDLIYDQMVAAGVAASWFLAIWAIQASVRLHGVNRAIEKSFPEPLALEEYSHYGMVARYPAAPRGCPSIHCVAI